MDETALSPQRFLRKGAKGGRLHWIDSFVAERTDRKKDPNCGVLQKFGTFVT
jgi:hypothetical protein